MHGYPHFSFWVPITLAKIYVFPIVITFAKTQLYQEAPSLIQFRLSIHVLKNQLKTVLKGSFPIHSRAILTLDAVISIHIILDSTRTFLLIKLSQKFLSVLFIIKVQLFLTHNFQHFQPFFNFLLFLKSTDTYVSFLFLYLIMFFLIHLLFYRAHTDSGCITIFNYYYYYYYCYYYYYYYVIRKPNRHLNRQFCHSPPPGFQMLPRLMPYMNPCGFLRHIFTQLNDRRDDKL